MKLYILLFAVTTVMADDTNVESTFQEANNHFTALMFHEAVKKTPDKNLVLSAFSVLQPLAQLALASEGESHNELLRAIGLSNESAIKETFPVLNRKLQSIKGVELKLANKIYIPNGYTLKPDFETVSKEVFGSEVQNIDFTHNVEAAAEINTWVEDHTNHRIKDLVAANSLGALTAAVLVNAIYFKGTWKDKFNRDATRPMEFHVSKDKIIEVPTMHKTAFYKYGESEELKAQLLELPYAENESSLVIVLPRQVDGLPELQEKLRNPSTLTTAVKKMNEVEVEVYLPKFKIETNTNLKELLSNVGVTKIFDPRSAKLTGFLTGSSGLYVSEAIQKAFIEVNEEGAEAAAANQFGISLLSAVISPHTFTFKANHPFVFLLMENNNALFSGVFQS